MSVVVVGQHGFRCAAGTPLKPERWAHKAARLARMDRLCALALVACDGAIIDAGLATESIAALDSERTAIVLGTAYGCHATNEEYYRGFLRDGAEQASPRLFAYTLPSSPVGEISIHYQLRGPTATLTSGLAAGLDALAEARRLIVQGRAGRALVVVADVATPFLQKILGAELEDAACAFVVEGEASAKARGAKVRGTIGAISSRACETSLPQTAVPKALAVAPLHPFKVGTLEVQNLGGRRVSLEVGVAHG